MTNTAMKVLFSVLAALMLGLTLLWVPEWMANQYPFADTKDWASQVAANRAMMVNLLGGAAVAITIYFTYQNFRIAQDNLKVTQDNLKVTQDKAMTDAFAKAVEQLGNPDMSVRLGGIYSLGRFAKISREDYFPVMQILAGFIRTKYRAPAPDPPREVTSQGASRCPVEVQRILTIIGERYFADPDGYAIDLSYIDICDAWVPGSNFSNLYLWSVRLTNWNFEKADLSDADLSNATLANCNFTGANLTRADLDEVALINPTGLTKEQLDAAVNVDPTLYELL
jgi:hypothetical protein